MGLRKLVRGLSASLDDLERERLGTRFVAKKLGVTSVGDLEGRQRASVLGEVVAVRVVPRSGSPWLEVTVDDGTGAIIGVFTGRRRIRGVDPGRALLLEGVVRKERNRVLLLNPAYTLLP